MRTRGNGGFTLVEVLVATFVISVGLLGVASLGLTGLRSNNQAYWQSQVSLAAADMADRIRANRNADYVSAFPAGHLHHACFTGNGCSDQQLAEVDVYEWQSQLAETLPQGTGALQYDGGVYTVSVGWDGEFAGRAGSQFDLEFAL